MTEPSTIRAIRIGQLARAAGLSPDTLRHYERIGVLPPPARTGGGFREYGQEAIRRVRVIQGSLAIGFTLPELAAIFRERAAGRTPCRRVRALAEGKLHALEEQIGELKRLRSRLKQILLDWDSRLVQTSPVRAAGLLEALGDAEPTRRPAGRLPGRPLAARIRRGRSSR
jgi:DNA-binding transcriptional MerR regulator